MELYSRFVFVFAWRQNSMYQIIQGQGAILNVNSSILQNGSGLGYEKLRLALYFCELREGILNIGKYRKSGTIEINPQP